DALVGLGGLPPERAKVLAEPPGHWEVAPEITIALARVDGDLDLRRERRAPRAPLHDGANPLELAQVSRANGDFCGGRLGDDGDGLAAVRDVAVHADAIAEMDALRIDETEGIHARGERTVPLPRGERGMRGRPLESELEPHAGERRVGEEVAIEGVEH